MEYSKLPQDAFKHIQLNAGIVCDSFDTSSKEVGNILGSTNGGINFNAAPEYADFADNFDNCPANTMQLKRLMSVTATLSGTFKSVDASLCKKLVAAADMSGGHITPRADLTEDDFSDIWFVGDYSDVNSGENAGYIAIHLINALSTGGFQIQSNDKGTGDFSFTFTGHYDFNDPETVPYEVYISQGS